MFNRTTAWILVAALAAGLGLLAAWQLFGRGGETKAPQLEAVTLLPQPRELPAFNLRQSDGTPLVAGELAGHWTLVFLGFTFCPDVCPTTLAELAQAQKQWESMPESTRPRVLFVSVDPERDTPGKTGEYAHAFHPDTLAATADVPALEKFATSLGFVFMKAPGANFEHNPQDYSVDHSAHIAVLDPQGRLAGLIRPPLQPQAIAADLITLDAMGRAR
ncbi:MAG: SCO family protein [Pseudoxanthomonas sp.]|nr:SCO family protein [Pseudoxanthomonas sp.]TXI29605.1 MAG: SCO family protein [Ottowia sp.]MBP7466406.1 SCO family protein [Pseudoxanthomonas sp.]MBP8741753.1 SCO family protein [Pseudoxanthomonas sp.]MBP8804200.1 SCO family protein [Pseudoxanthomonas sp.]